MQEVELAGRERRGLSPHQDLARVRVYAQPVEARAPSGLHLAEDSSTRRSTAATLAASSRGQKGLTT